MAWSHVFNNVVSELVMTELDIHDVVSELVVTELDIHDVVVDWPRHDDLLR